MLIAAMSMLPCADDWPWHPWGNSHTASDGSSPGIHVWGSLLFPVPDGHIFLLPYGPPRNRPHLTAAQCWAGLSIRSAPGLQLHARHTNERGLLTLLFDSLLIFPKQCLILAM